MSVNSSVAECDFVNTRSEIAHSEVNYSAGVMSEWVALEAEIVRVYQAERSIDRTVAALGLGAVQVRNVLRKNGLIRGRRVKVSMTDEDMQTICALRDRGYLYREIMRETGWSKGSIWAAINQRRGLA